MAEETVQPAAHEDAKADTRTAAKWLIAAFAAVGAALLSGVGLNAIGHVQGDRLTLTIAAFSVGIAGVIVAVYLITDILTPSPMTLADVARFERNRNLGSDAERHDELVSYLESDPTFLQGIVDTEAVPKDQLLITASQRYAEVVNERFRTSEAVWSAKEVSGPDSDAAKEAEAKAKTANARANTVHATVRRLEQIISAQQTVLAFRERRGPLAVTAIFVACGIGVFAAAANPPEAATADLRGAVLTKVDLSGASLREANLEGMTIRSSDLRGTNLEGANVKNTVWIDTVCPDGTNSDNAGKTCEGHLEP
jgi:hypothetical protein